MTHGPEERGCFARNPNGYPDSDRGYNNNGGSYHEGCSSCFSSFASNHFSLLAAVLFQNRWTIDFRVDGFNESSLLAPSNRLSKESVNDPL